MNVFIGDSRVRRLISLQVSMRSSYVTLSLCETQLTEEDRRKHIILDQKSSSSQSFASRPTLPSPSQPLPSS